jgi:hypothetical protein
MRFAPPPKKLVRGGLAVPIDIEAISAQLTFDARAHAVAGEAVLRFRHGVEDGFPIFDLRQPVTAAWLDGRPLEPGSVDFHRFGARREQALRMVRRELMAGGQHELRVGYLLAAPPLLASKAGGYQPELTWGDGGRVNFNFGFTDLGGGRYLEAWVPANLIYDRFALELELRLLHTATPHAVVTNGTVSEESRNHWHIRFPETFTALSPLLQLHPRDAVEQAVRQGIRRIEAWKFRDSTVDLETALDNIERLLHRNEQAIGPYLHGDRYVAFLHKGGMEYDGACTSSLDALEHEVFHSWWARGLKPASQNDGWIDEAWTVYHDGGAAGVKPFDFSEPPVRLSARTPWNRATPIASYRLGSRFFEGIAAQIGIGRLHAVMNEFYARHAPGLISTAQLEAHILDRTNDDAIRRAFARWVYGRAR